MKNKPLSLFLFFFGLLLIFILFISEEPGQGFLRTVGFSFSCIVIAAALTLACLWSDQNSFLKDLIHKIHPKKTHWKILLPVLIFIWPLIIFWQLVLPTRFSRGIGNDFIPWYYTYKVYLLAHLSRLELPFWSPAEAAGFPFTASPLTQSFYPLNLPFAVYSLFRGGISILSYQTYTILGISIFALGLYMWLSTLRIKPITAGIVSLLIPISYKLIETARFPNAVHTAAWFPWLLLMLTLLFKIKSIRQTAVWSAAGIVLATLLITAGYPYFVYYLLFLVPPYLLLLTIPNFRKQLINDTKPPRWDLITSSLGVSGLISLLLLLPYLRSMSSLLNQTAHRAGENLTWSTGVYSADPLDFIASAIFPPAAISEGWFYFGFLALLVIIFFLTASLKNGDEDQKFIFSRQLVVFFLIWIALIAYLGWDNNTTPFNFFWNLLWNYLPGFNKLRVWSRINILLLPIFSLILARALEYLYQLLKEPDRLRRSRLEMIVTAVAASGIVGFQKLLNRPEKFSRYWDWMEHGSPDVYLILGLVSTGIFFGLIFTAWRWKIDQSWLPPLLIVCFLFSIFDAVGGQLSPWIWIQPENKHRLTKIHAAWFEENQSRRLPDQRVLENIAIPLDGEYNVWASRISWHYQRYVDFLKRTDEQEDARQVLLGQTEGQVIFFTSRIDYPYIADFLSDAEALEREHEITILDFQGDKLTLLVSTSAVGYLSYIDNWDEGWVAAVDGEEIPIELLWGTFKSIPLSPGSHRIEFKYKPW